MYIICIKYLISNKWRQVIILLIESSIIMNSNNMYMICVKDFILKMMPSYNPVISKVLYTTVFKK